ncbi:polysaccharide biosynthesis/export family protein [Shigella boydii]
MTNYAHARRWRAPQYDAGKWNRELPVSRRPGDVLDVTSLGSPRNSPRQPVPYRSSSDTGNWVQPDGTMFYPYIGKVHVVGKHALKSAGGGAGRLATNIRRLTRRSQIAAFRSQKAYLSGQVNDPVNRRSPTYH